MAGKIVQLDEKQLNTIVSLYTEHGLTQRTIATRYGISEARVRKTLRRNGLPGRRGKSRKEWIQEVNAM